MIIDALAIIFWPATALAVVVYFLIKKPQVRQAFAIVVAILIAPLAIFLFILGNESMPLVVDRQLGWVAMGAYFIYLYRTQVPDRKIGFFLFGFTGFGCIGWGGWYLVGDYLFPRDVVEGKIQRLHRQYTTSRTPYEFIARIHDQDYKLPRRTFSSLHKGELVRAEVGRGSRYIFEMETLDPGEESAGPETGRDPQP